MKRKSFMTKTVTAIPKKLSKKSVSIGRPYNPFNIALPKEEILIAVLETIGLYLTTLL